MGFVVKKRKQHHDPFAEAVIYTNHASAKSMDNPVYMSSEIVVNGPDLHFEPSGFSEDGRDDEAGQYLTVDEQIVAISRTGSEDPLCAPALYDTIKH